MEKNRSEFSSRWKKADGKTPHQTVAGLLKHRAILSEENYRDLVESSGSIIMKTDPHLNITYMNDFGLKFLGYSIEELLGKNVIGTTIPARDDAGRDLEAMAEEIRNSPRSFGTNVHQNMRKNGELVWISWTNMPKYDKDGNLAEILAIGNDISKLIKAEDALRESRAQSEMLVKYAPTGIYEMDFNGPRFISVNDAVCDVTGYTREELLSMDPFRLLDEQSAAVFRERAGMILSGQQISENIEYKIRAKDGRVLWATLTVRILSDNGRNPRALVIAHDITERMRLQDELKKYNETLEERVRLRTEEVIAERKRMFDVLETLPAMICLLTRDYHVIFANRSFREKFGESKGRRCFEYCFNKKQPCEFCQAYTVLKTGMPHQWEVVLTDGTIIEVNDFPFSDADGSPSILEMDFDITQQKHASHYTRSLIEASLDPLVTINTDGKITDVNGATVRATGFSRKKLIGTEFSDYFTEPEKARESYKVVFSKGMVKNYPLTIRHRNGRLTDVLYNASLFADVNGKIMGVFAAARDVTVLKRAEDELKRSREEIEKLYNDLLRSNRELENFAYVASHDLQEPLRMITSFTQLLAMKYNEKFNEEAREYMAYIVDGGKRMYGLINGLLAYSRTGRQEITFSNVDLNKIIDIVKSNLAVKIKETSCRIDCGDLPTVYANRDQMIQLFQNLVSNGIKFSKDQPHVYISCKAEREEYIFSVRDEGIGIEPQYFDKIFLIFKRLMPRNEYEGTGIGLSICKKIVENHQGQIWVESEPGKGSIFYFTLPRRTGESD